MSEASLALQVGAIIRATRLEHGWSQDTLAARVRTSQSTIARLESGQLAFLDATLVSRVFAVLGIRSAFDARTLGLASRREQRDVVHAACEAHVARRLGAAGWEPRLELEIGSGRWRGWIDLLAYRPLDRALLLGEIKSELDDFGRIERTLGWYEREAPAVAERLGWHPATLRTALIVLVTDENDERLTRNAALLGQSFAGTAADLARWVAEPGVAPPARSIAMIDPRSRRASWLMSTRSQGRRTRARFADYAEAARAITTRRAPRR